MRAAVAIALCATIGCGTDDKYVVVTVDSRPAVHDAVKLAVTLSNAGSTRMDELTLGTHPFPVTFSVSSPGRTGDLGISVDALDANGLLVGRGTIGSMTNAASAHVMLDSADFVVNTQVADDQFPSNDFEANGFQLAALPDGTWTAVYRDKCIPSCNMYARRFDKTGKPVQTTVAASTMAFPLSTVLTTSASTPAVASGGTMTVGVWDFYDTAGATHGVACRALDATGSATADQLLVSTDSADVVDVTAMSNGNFMASWSAFVTTNEVHAVAIKPDCTAVGAQVVVSTTTGAGGAHRASVVAGTDRVLFTWIVDGEVHIRLATPDGAFITTDTALITKTATEEVYHARSVAVAGGFVIFVRWAQSNSFMGPGRIEMFRVTTAGALMGGPMLVTDKSASDADNTQSFGAASRPDGSIMAVWHTCGTLGDGSGCGVFGRILSSAGTPVTDVFNLATSTTGDQTSPSVVGLADAFVASWSDASMGEPDHAGLAVRARIIYPPGAGGS